ncbi:MAG: M48 family metallopeptidase [Clostridia bacterium]|nr:M48 family metallopeptidase [Clostridia bacterium]
MDNQELLIPNKIIKSNRKSISLVIKNNSEFIVRCPMRCKESDIYSFIAQKSDWIIKKRLEQASNLFNPLTCDKPEQIRILGKSYDIHFTNKNRVKLYEDVLEVPNTKPKEKIVGFLKTFARKYLTERVKLIADLFNFSYSKLTISSAKTNWGSCSLNDSLHFTYKLMMCPEDVVDYIVLHELCHTKVKNHSNKFWSLVEACNPNYKTHEKWLKKNRGIIEVI